MLSPQLRRKVNNLWTMFWSSGITNPLTAIEQITYLLFLKHLELLDEGRVKDKKKSIYAVEWLGEKKIKDGEEISPKNYEQCRWENIHALANNPSITYELHDLLTEIVFPWLRILDEILRRTGNNANTMLEAGRMMEDAYFQLPREKADTLKTAINTIDDLFTLEAHSDLMGDIFEELLLGIKSAGRNGQFRTPRHIIRFMVELVNPTPNDRVVDPAAGTGGFLFASIQHLLKQAMLDAELENDLRLEWDGTPHRLRTSNSDQWFHAEQFTGFDNDRTMVRIGWMNLILHGIENPRIELRDSLGKGLPDTESSQYQVVLANPPFTGIVDSGDLHQSRFPFVGTGRKRKALTDKSELLFVWLVLDLLAVGGRAAVIVPDGVLFGSTTAHRQLRRQLLFEHDLKAVISLPAGVFQPYSGVKTSILVFHKVGEAVSPGVEPHTRAVWFYEVVADGLTLDAKRNPDYTRNDLWDALEKYPKRTTQPERLDYFQPHIFDERWRVVDDKLLNPKLYPDLVAKKGKTRSLHELFTDLPADPAQATEIIIDTQRLKIAEAFEQYLTGCLGTISATIVQAAQTSTDPNTSSSAAREKARECLTEFTRFFNSARRDKDFLESEFDQFGRTAFKAALDAETPTTDAWLEPYAERAFGAEVTDKPTITDWKPAVEDILREFAKLDGFNIKLRAPKVFAVESPYKESRSWLSPVRVYARDDDWQVEGIEGKGTHDENGLRPAYLQWLKDNGKFNEDGSLTDSGVLESACIEANDFNLSAARYKPFALETTNYGEPADLIKQLRDRELNILKGLEQLLAVLEGQA